jgi:hypothetical protein
VKTPKAQLVFSSQAEFQFYEAATKALSKEWLIIPQLTLAKSKRDAHEAEMDFVLFHQQWGLFVIEVKGGRIRFENQQFYSVNRAGETFAIKNPFQQALSFKARLVRYLKDKNIQVPISYAVCFPTVSKDEFSSSASSNTDLIIGRDELRNLNHTLKTIAKISHEPKFFDFNVNQSTIQKALIGTNYQTRLNLKDYMSAHEKSLRQIEDIHTSLVAPAAGMLRLGVEGEAGTGKTVLASYIAQHFSAQSKRVLFLSSSELLAEKLRGLLTGLRVETYISLAKGMGVDLLNPPSKYKNTREKWINEDAAKEFMQALTEQGDRYDVILCDEAQDVDPSWWPGIEKLFDVHQNEKRFYVFFDRSQGIFSAQFEPEKVLPVAGPYLPMVHNYRTTFEIAHLSRSFRRGKHVLVSHSARFGYIPQIITYKNKEDFQTKLEALYDQLLSREGLNIQDVCLLSARKLQAAESVLKDVSSLKGIPIQKIDAKTRVLETDKLSFSTIHAFKGMETQVGILCNIDEYALELEHPLMASLVYVAMTRAKHMLYIFCKEGSAKHKRFMDLIAGIPQQKALVIDPHDGDQEFIGTVVHYNPKRFGYLEVKKEGAGIERIMFFTQDIDQQIRLGDQVRFRAAIEAQVPIAIDLHRVSAS